MGLNDSRNGQGEDLAHSGSASASDGADYPHVGLHDTTPRLKPWQERFVHIFTVVALLFATYYIVWRWTDTLNYEALWFSVPLALAETYGLFTAFFLAVQAWTLKKRTPPPAPAGLDVDVFITTYDEPESVIRRTALGARDIRYPHETFILDDGKRDEIRELARELGIGYIRREGNEHAKAGNLNNALEETDGDFILQLDADHVPLPHILDRLLGFFDDPDVAFAQSPQDFYNTDSFTHQVSDDDRYLWEEQQIFFSLLQPGKDHWNAAFFCGSCGVLRREAFEEIGGFSTETITEDMETSIILHGRGWKSVYYGESMAFGLAPAGAGAFHVQRLRWGQGSMQILRKFNPLTYPGLTLAQRISYFASVTSYLDGLFKLILYLAPVVFFFTGILPIRVDNAEFLIRFIPYLILSLGMFELLSRGTGYLWLAERYNMAKFFTYILAISGYFAPKLKFNVTPKGAGEVPFRTYAPQLFLAILTAGSVLFATAAYAFGWIDYEVPGWGSLAFWFNLAWAVYNFFFAAYIVRLSLRLRQQREDHRFAESMVVRIRPGDEPEGEPTPVVAENLNLSGMGFRSTRRFHPGSEIQVELPLATGTILARGHIVRTRETTDRAGTDHTEHGVKFHDLDNGDRNAIEVHCTRHAVPMQRMRYKEVVDLFQRLGRWWSDARGTSRGSVKLPVRLRIENHGAGNGGPPATERFAILEEISDAGARFLLEEPIPPGSRLEFEVPESRIAGRGSTVYTRAQQTPIGVRYVIGVSRTDNENP